MSGASVVGGSGGAASATGSAGFASARGGDGCAGTSAIGSSGFASGAGADCCDSPQPATSSAANSRRAFFIPHPYHLQRAGAIAKAPLTRAPHPGSCTGMGWPLLQEFSRGVIHTYPSAHKKCHPHRWGVRGLRGEISQLRQTRCLPVPYFFLNFLKSMFCAPAPPAVNGAQLDPPP